MSHPKRKIVEKAIIFSLLFCMEGELYTYAEKGRDPFVCVVASVLSEEKKEKKKCGSENIAHLLTNIRLEGVLYAGAEERGVVIINGQILKEGDRFKEFLIKRIKPKKVILEYGKEEVEFSLVDTKNKHKEKDLFILDRKEE